jgi:hypothetical protein
MNNNIISPFHFEESAVTDEEFLAMMKNNDLHHIPAGTVFQSDGAPPHFSSCVHVFLDSEFPDHWIGR